MMDEIKKMLKKLGIEGEIFEVDPDEIPDGIKEAVIKRVEDLTKKSPKARKIDLLVGQVNGFLNEAASALVATTTAKYLQSQGRPYYNLKTEDDSKVEHITKRTRMKIAKHLAPEEGKIIGNDVEAYLGSQALDILESMLQQALKDVSEIRKAHNKGTGPDISPSRN